MKFQAIKLFIITIVLSMATSAFATLNYEVIVDTSTISDSDGYLYFQYGGFNGVNSTATLYSYNGGTLAATNSTSVVDGSAVTGMLPGTVVFANTNGTNDYNHGILFGTSLKFNLAFDAAAFGLSDDGSSTFSLGLFSDEGGLTPLVTTTGTLFTIDLMNNGTFSHEILATGASVNPVPEPTTFLLLGSGLACLAGVRRRTRK